MATNAGLRTERKALLAETCTGKSKGIFSGRHTFFRQGDPANALFFIERGTVKLAVVSAQGKEAIVALLGANEFFGAGCLAGLSRRTSTATALSEVSVLRIEKATAGRLLRNDAEFSRMITAHLLERLIRIEADLADHIFNSSEKRLARLLLLLANFGADQEPRPVILKINQETLAQMVGTTRARVNSFMTKFRDQGFISYSGQIEVHPSLLNAVLNERRDFEGTASRQ